LLFSLQSIIGQPSYGGKQPNTILSRNQSSLSHVTAASIGDPATLEITTQQINIIP
jgi:hypothetical protein